MKKETTKEVSVKVIDKNISLILPAAQKLEIVDAETMKEAVSVLSTINQWNDRVVAYKESKTKPLNLALKIIRDETRPLETRLTEVIGQLRRKITTYQTEAKRVADEEAAKIAARVGEGKGKLKVETAVRQIDEVEKPDALVASDDGLVKFKTVKKFEVMDMTMLPIEYHLADETAIRKQMAAGIELKGVRYYNEEVPVNFR